jgi:hypothetical protein
MRYSVLALLFLGLMAPATIFAQTQEKTSTGEEVAIAFFKAGGVSPDFIKWAKKSKSYNTVQKAREAAYFEKETRRLNGLWQNYNPATDMIVVKTSVFIALNMSVDEKDKAAHSMTLAFDKGAADYFPFQFQDYMIAVIPQHLNTLMQQPLQKAQYDLMHSSFGDKTAGHGTLYLMLKAIKADTSRPYSMDDHEQWMFVTDVAGLSLKTQQGSPLWNYSAPWYITPTSQDVRNLFTMQERQERADDAAEGIIP